MIGFLSRLMEPLVSWLCEVFRFLPLQGTPHLRERPLLCNLDFGRHGKVKGRHTGRRPLATNAAQFSHDFRKRWSKAAIATCRISPTYHPDRSDAIKLGPGRKGRCQAVHHRLRHSPFPMRPHTTVGRLEDVPGSRQKACGHS